MNDIKRDPGDAWPWGADFDTVRKLNVRSGPGVNPNASAVFANDGPGYTATDLIYVYVYSDRPPISHHKKVQITTGQYDNDRSGVSARCIGIFCVAYATLPNGSHRLLSGRTEFVDNAGGWEVYSFRVSDMREGPDR